MVVFICFYVLLFVGLSFVFVSVCEWLSDYLTFCGSDLHTHCTVPTVR